MSYPEQTVNSYTIAVDIGNTNTHIGLIKCATRSILSLDIFPSRQLDERFIVTIRSIVDSLQHAMPVPIVICSVIKSIEERFGKDLHDSSTTPLVWLRYTAQLPLHIPYDDPLLLGADRIANMLYSSVVFAHENVIIIDAGTTITVDYLQNGRDFIGGVILPGPATQLKSLHASTDQLPQFEPGTVTAASPGLSTETCMDIGVRYGIAGALSLLVGKYSNLFNGPCRILATGGAWPYLKDAVTFEVKHIPELTMVGCALYANVCNRPI